MSWARLLKRVFDIDIEHCPNCGGHLKIIAAIEDPPVISSAIWACPPAPHRAHQRSDSIYSKRPEKTKLLANASRRRPLALSSSGAGAIRNKSRPSRPPLRPSRLVQLRVFYITPVIEKGGLKSYPVVFGRRTVLCAPAASHSLECWCRAMYGSPCADGNHGESTIAHMSRFSKIKPPRSPVRRTASTMARAKSSARITWPGNRTRNAG
jgi:hypothetical protein